MERILVVGASGTTGHKIVERLKTSDQWIPIAMVRNSEQEAYFKTRNVETIFGDLEQDVADTVNTADKVVFAAGSGGEKVEAVDRDGAIKMIRASEQAGIKKFVMLSAMGVDNPEQSDTLKDYLKAKQEADVFLKNSALNYAIVRPGALTNNKGKGKIELAKSLGKFGEISRDDVAETLVKSLLNTTANTTTFEIIQGENPISEALENIS